MKTLLTIIGLAIAMCSFAQPATVLAEQKISDTQGNFLEPLASSDHFGNSVAGLGDLNNDGVEDIVVGAEGVGVGGSIYVLFMNTNGTVNTSQQITTGVGGFVGPLSSGDDFGYTVANIGDLDNDGVVDIAVGAEEDSNKGAVWILFMNTDGTVKAEQKITESVGGFTGSIGTNNRFSYGLAGIGDLNNDGNEDIAVGALMDDDGGNGRGAVWILFLNSNGTVASHQKISDTQGNFLAVLQNADNFGSAVAGLGDLDGDGNEDIAVGAYLDDDGSTDAGAVYILFLNSNGTVSSFQKISDTQGGFTGIIGGSEYFGNEGLANMGDINGDGIVDLAVGQNWDGDGGAGKGSVWTLFLNTNGTVSGYQKISETVGGFVTTLDSYDLFGTGIANIGDLDGDGKTDMAVGAPYDDDGGSAKGAVYILNLDGVAPACINPDVPSGLSASPSTVCPGASTTITWAGALNSATEWHIYTGACGGTEVGTSVSNSYTTGALGATTTFYIRGEDGAGCVDESSGACGMITVTVGDAISPTAVCQNINAYVDGAGNASIVAADIDGGSSDNCSGITLSASQTMFTCADLGANSVTLTVTDGASNTDNCVAIVTVLDTVSPVITCPGNQTESPDASCNFVLPDYTALAAVSDNCSGSPTVTQSPVASTVISGTTTVTLTADDGNGNTSQCTFDVVLNDATPPTAICQNINVYLDGAGNASIVAADIDGGSSDNCSGFTLSASQTTFTCADLGANSITLTVTDGASNTDNCVAIVTVLDTISPVVTCPGNQTGSVNAGCGFVLPDYTGLAVATDNCMAGLAVTQTPAPGTTIGVGTTVVTLTATDGSSNASSCNFSVVVSDNTNPTITCPGDQTESVNASCQLVLPDYTSLATVTDNCDASPTVTQSPVPGTVVSSNTVVTLTVTDLSANSDNCSFTVILNDVTPPSITCPGNQTEASDASCQFTLPDYTSMATVSDNCTASPGITQNPLPGTIISGTTTITLTATDGASNTADCSFTVTLNDITPPSITCPGNQAETPNASCQFVLPDYTALATVTDNCNASPTVTQSPASGTTISGTTTITLTADDGNGNTSQCSFDVTLNDGTAPTAVCQNMTVYLDGAGTGAITANDLDGGSTDNCSGITLSASQTLFTCADLGANNVTLTVTDGSSNSSNCIAVVTVLDTISPSASNPIALNVECIGDVPAPDALVVTDETDNCSVSPVVTFVSDVSDGNTCPEVITRTYSVDDGNGNSITVTQTITVNDVTPPTASNPAAINVECSGDVPAPDVLVVTDEADNCTASPVVTFVSDVSDGNSCPETITRTYSVTDDCNNTMSVTQTITVNDLTSPVEDQASLPDLTDGCSIAMPTAPTATDNCSGSVTATPDVSFPITTAGTTVITWTYADDCGNTTTQTQNAIITPIDVSTTTTLSSDDYYEIAANATGYTYQWIENCGTTNDVIAGATSIDYTPSANGSYAVIIDDGTCSDTSDCVIIDDLGVGIMESLNVSIYPNPNQGVFTLKFEANHSFEKVEILATDGRTIYTKSLLSVKNDIDLSDQPSGIYFMHLIGVRTIVQKIVVE